MALTPQQQALQNKIDVLDSSASTSTLLGLLVQSLDEGKIIWSYDSSGQIPVDSDYHGMIHFTHDSDKIRFVGTSSKVHLLDSQDTAPPGVTSAPYQGSISGYSAGGINPAVSPTVTNVIQKFSLTADEDATDVGNLTQIIHKNISTGSTTHGYRAGGAQPGTQNVIDKWSFTSDGNATDVGDLTSNREYATSFDTVTHGYSVSGLSSPNTYSNIIEKYAYASDGNATDVGDTSTPRYSQTGIFSEDNGYAVGGVSVPEGSPFWKSDIQKMPFASEGDTTDLTDTLPIGRANSAPNNSTTHGYISGGEEPATRNTIFKYAFAEGADATDIGDLQQASTRSAGSNSTTHAYITGGTPNSNIIQKLPFATDEDTTDVANLLSTVRYGAGTQI